MNVGDRVVAVNTTESAWGNALLDGVSGTIIHTFDNDMILVEFDNDVDGHDAGGRGKYGHCWYLHGEDVEPLRRCRGEDLLKILE